MKIDEAIAKVKAACMAKGRPDLIPTAIGRVKNLYKAKRDAIEADLAYLEGDSRDGYIHDMKIAQRWASLNRRKIGERICKAMD